MDTLEVEVACVVGSRIEGVKLIEVGVVCEHDRKIVDREAQGLASSWRRTVPHA